MSKAVTMLCALASCWLGVPHAGAAETPLQAHYAGYAKGLNLFDIDIAVTLHRADYRLEASFKLVGVLAALLSANGSTVVDGRFTTGRTKPRALMSRAHFGGKDHVLQIGWPNDQPTIIQMVPPPEPGREPVAVEDRAQTIDTLSAIAGLMHQVTETGRCENATRTFDGERLMEFDARTAGEETLEPTPRSSFQGAALRCDVTARMIGGFMVDSNHAKAREPKHGTAWFARLQPDQPAIPVRIVFYDKGSPSATLYLRQPAPADSTMK